MKIRFLNNERQYPAEWSHYISHSVYVGYIDKKELSYMTAIADNS